MDRRSDTRMILRLEIMLFDENGNEYCGQTADISENGFCFVLSEDTLPENPFAVGDLLTFQFLDYFQLYGTLEQSIIQGTASVVHAQRSDTGWKVGCYSGSCSLQQYVAQRKVAVFVNQLSLTRGFYEQNN